MTRRTFFEFLGTGLCVLAGSLVIAGSRVQVILRKVRGRLKAYSSLPSGGVEQQVVELPREGERVSVERALNSRCSSDYDNDPEIFHWGMFDTSARLSSNQVDRIVRLAERCRLSERGTRVETDQEALTFSADAAELEHAREARMIESGMQQQAVCLVCAALGAALVFDSQGPDGTYLSNQHFVATKMRLGAMKPSYGKSFWSTAAPENERPWLTGNLPDPKRDSQAPLLMAIEDFQPNRKDGARATLSDVSQLLWAARGRTPHLYKSNPWGLTIPTWQGLQNISSVHVAASSKLYQYVNWKNGRPTHRIEAEATAMEVDHLQHLAPGTDCFLVLTTDEAHTRALWEVGYQLLNIILQARALGLSYRTQVLSEKDRLGFAGMSRGTPVAMVALRAANERLLESI
ncbi:MAG: hypothetical protein LAP86_26760 [Acidobacteriia bacterium]|nr:hypothetical protein [Terriglobia bacterium]